MQCAGLILFDFNVRLGFTNGVSMFCAVGVFDRNGGCNLSFLSKKSFIIVFIFFSLFSICLVTQSPIELIRFVKNIFSSFNCSLFAQFLWQGADVITSLLSNIKGFLSVARCRRRQFAMVKYKGFIYVGRFRCTTDFTT